MITADLARARCRTQIDIGFGDAITPGPVQATYPVPISDFPAPSLRTCPVYTVVAEKLHAIALLGMTNSRLKDYLDISLLLNHEALDVDILAATIDATFMRRGMTVPAQFLIGLTDEFANDGSRQRLWMTFLRKNELALTSLASVVKTLRDKLEPALQQAMLIKS